LTDLGISPHPRVVLALEGETEVYHAPLVWRTLGYSSAPELIRVLKLGGVGQNLQKVAALNVAPLISKQVPAPGATAWTVIRPFAHLLMAVDPGVERPNPDELKHLVEIRVWNAPCYECQRLDGGRADRGVEPLAQRGQGNQARLVPRRPDYAAQQVDRQVGIRGQQAQAGRSSVACLAPEDPARHGDGRRARSAHHEVVQADHGAPPAGAVPR
jgi:hypothetical protein